MTEEGAGSASSTKDGPPDLTLVAEDVEMSCHRQKLCEASAYFSAMFRSNMRESNAKQIEIRDISPYVLQVLIDYSYQKTLHLSMNNVYDILNGASMLQFTKVIGACSKFMSTNLNVDNCLSMLFIADSNGLESEYFKAKNVAFWHFSEVVSNKEFWQLPLTAVQDYLSSDILNISTEFEIFEAICKWIMYNKTDRIMVLPQLLRQVRFGCLSKKEINKISNHEFVTELPECTSYLNQVQGGLSSDDEVKKKNSKVCFTKREVPRTIWMIGGELQLPDKKVPMCGVTCFDHENRTVCSVYDDITPLAGHKQEYLGYMTCVVGKDVYLCGGEVKMGRNQWQLDVWCFNTFDGEWKIVSQLPQPRRHLTLVSLNEDLYLIGGLGRHRIMLDSVEKYNSISGDWSKLPNLNSATYSAAACVHQGKIYVIKHEIECFTPGDMCWTKITMALPFEIGIHHCVSARHNIYIVGSYILDLIEFDPQSLTLRNLGKFKDACGPVALWNEKIYVLSGENSKNIESYNLKTAKFCVEQTLADPIVWSTSLLVPYFAGSR